MESLAEPVFFRVFFEGGREGEGPGYRYRNLRRPEKEIKKLFSFEKRGGVEGIDWSAVYSTVEQKWRREFAGANAPPMTKRVPIVCACGERIMQGFAKQ